METYSGQCHCGTVQFEVRLTAPITNAKRCNCSLCRRKGALMTMIPKTDLTVVRGEDNLSLYQWNTKIARHYFCKTCGIYTHHQRRSDPSAMGVNIGCLDGVDPTRITEIDLVDGASFSSVNP